jgi:antitoxin component YwqK of YwqJK toxin-antitoxin module/peroxiredoxin
MKKSSPSFLLLAVCVLASCKFVVQKLIDYRDTWANGLPKTRGQLAGEKQTGEWTLYFESGSPLAKGAYKDDRQFGPWTFYYESGAEQRSGAYDDAGLRTGEWLYSYEDATPKARGSYVGDFEDGRWTFYADTGAVIKEGAYQNGKQSGLWTYYYPSGKLRAEGVYHRGARVGAWQLCTEAGGSRLQDFGSAAGVTLAREVWPGTEQARRVGALANGVPAGRWTSFHQNGQLRFSCGWDQGVPDGVFVARDEQGTVVAQGRFAGGAVAAGGLAVAGGVARGLTAGALAAELDGVARWSTTSQQGDASPERRLSGLVEEQRAGAGAAGYAAVVLAVGAATPPPAAAETEEVVQRLDEEPTRQPAPAQPQLTVAQKQKLDRTVDEYENGPKRGRSMFSGSDYAPAAGSPRPAGGTGRREQLEGKTLPFDVIEAIDGGSVDLRDYRGKKRVMLVVLRGFLGEVCVYCVAQTKALAKARKKLEDNNVEVLVIYPGPRENELAFRQIYEQEFGEGPPPYRVFYDQDLELVTKLGIEGDLASPSTFLLDEQGVCRYAYVGEHRADRPATKKLIKLIEGMK